jgi:peptidyl-dipeptidase A
MKQLYSILLSILIFIMILGCGLNQEEKQLQTFIETHVEKVKPLEKEANLAYWDASISGKSEDYDRSSKLQLQLTKIYSSKDNFTYLKSLKESGQIKNPLLARQLTVLYNSYLKNQIDSVLMKQIINLSTEIEKKFSTSRPVIDGKKVTTNQIYSILKSETDSNKRKKAWLASKAVGSVIAKDVIHLAKLRNKAARQLGFDNYHTLSLTTTEMDVEDLNRIMDELYGLTYQPFETIKHELDSLLADQYGIPVSEIAPWHYHDPYFQEVPLLLDLDLDKYYQDKDVKELSALYYNGIGMSVKSILKKSDLYEKEGKNPHGFCTDIDREGDIRILCNLQNNEQWMETMLHELGHAVYDQYIDADLPFILRSPAHSFTTEAVAMFFGRLSRNASWMKDMLGLSEEERAQIHDIADQYTRYRQLIFARWVMVMYNFEREFYSDPEQDLNALWWQLKEKYQLVTKPKKRNEPDWASKIHVALYPCYYHNYLLGELLASQFHYHIVHNILKLESDQNLSYVNQPEMGQFFQQKVFEPGNRYHWNTMIQKATGEPLNPEYFVKQFID